MVPKDLVYTRSHEWARIEEEGATVGISEYAQEQLGDLTFVELPAVGDEVSQGEEMGSIESVKAASELFSPVTGRVVEVNESLEDAPEQINEDPYEAGWLIKVELSEEPEGLMSPEEYEEYLEEEDDEH